MRKSWLLVILAAMVASLTFINVATAADQQVIKVGKKGEIQFNQETQIGDLMLKPGHYQMQHRLDGADHVVHFTELKMAHNPYYPSGPTGEAHPGDVKCRLETMDKKASQTAVTVSTEGGARRITRIEIQGENVAHVF